MKKGQINLVAMVFVTFALIGSMAVVGTDKVMNFDERIKKEALPIISQRIGISVYMVDGLERGRVTMKFKDEYNLTQKQGKVRVWYEDANAEVRAYEGVEWSLDQDIGWTKRICIYKTGADEPVKIKGGECDGY